MNSNPQPTPGQWRIVERPEQGTTNGRRITIEGKGAIVADLDWNTPAENQSNARLIAAAPDLLAACKDIAKCAENPSQVNGDILTRIASVARSAIALAQEGK